MVIGVRIQVNRDTFVVRSQRSYYVTIRSLWPLAIGTIVYAQVSHHIVHIMSMLHNVRCATRFWNNFHDISLKGQAIRKSFGEINAKWLFRITKIGYS